MPALWPHFDCHLAEDGLVTPIHHCQKAGKNSRWNFNIHNMHWKYENKSLPSCSSGLPGCAIMAHLDIGSFWTLLLAPNHPYIQDEHLTWVYSIKSWFFTFLYIKKKKKSTFFQGLLFLPRDTGMTIKKSKLWASDRRFSLKYRTTSYQSIKH